MCGVVGVFAPGRDAARLAYFALYALQHRGQESAGIAVSDGGRIESHVSMGLVGAIFDEEILGRLSGYLAVGHSRYSTTGSSVVVNAQPLLEQTTIGEFVFAHNGNLTNHDTMREALSSALTFVATSDSEVLSKAIVDVDKPTIEARIADVMERAEGAYSCVVGTERQLFGFRDPWGIRPLCVGRFDDGGYIIASESCALATVGAQLLREVEPGEIVIIDEDGLRSTRTSRKEPPALCMFEYIYFARPDSKLKDQSFYKARYEMGKQLAREHPADADVVMAVPDSAVPGGIGFATEAGLPYVEGLIKNRYIGRTFIAPDPAMRSQGVALKFNPILENLSGQRVVVVDDSIVRATTTPRIVKLLREVGAREVHVRVTSPPIINPCYLGINMATREELIAANFSIEGIRLKTGADSLGYLSLEGLVKATGRDESEFCLGCLNGKYPRIPDLELVSSVGRS